MRKPPLRGSQRSSRWPDALPLPTAAGPLQRFFSGRLARKLSLVPTLKKGLRNRRGSIPIRPGSLDLTGF